MTQRHLHRNQDSRGAITPYSNQNQSRKRNKRSRKNNPKRQRYDERGYDELGKPQKCSDADSNSDTDDSVDGDANEDGSGGEQCGKMFEACVREYGVPAGKEWKRMHRLFGTVIL